MTDAPTIALAARASDRHTRAALAAAKRVPVIFTPEQIGASAAQFGESAIRSLVADMAIAAGYLRCDGKDRREFVAQCDALLAGLSAADEDLLRRLYAGVLSDSAAPQAAIVLERLAADIRSAIEARLI